MFETRNNSGFLSGIPVVTRNLLIINIGMWLACSIMPHFGSIVYEHLGLHYWGADDFNPVQIVTYMFLQSPLGESMGIGHIFFNMFALYMFGRILELTWGPKRFMLFYFVCGAGAALVQELVWIFTLDNEFVSNLMVGSGLSASEVKSQLVMFPEQAGRLMEQFKNSMLTIGASGAVFGLLLGFGFVYPNVPMYLFFIPVPIKAKYLVGGYAVLEFFFGASGTMGTVAHFAHLGGMLFALILVLYWYKEGSLHGKRY